jgi:hypothetical protein
VDTLGKILRDLAESVKILADILSNRDVLCHWEQCRRTTVTTQPKSDTSKPNGPAIDWLGLLIALTRRVSGARVIRTRTQSTYALIKARLRGVVTRTETSTGPRGWAATEHVRRMTWSVVAEDAGFEPARGCPQHAFQACALGH